jgi:hypothetical protein
LRKPPRLSPGISFLFSCIPDSIGSVFQELPDKCRLSIWVDGGGDLIEPIKAVDRFELYIANRRGFQRLVVFVSSMK